MTSFSFFQYPAAILSVLSLGSTSAAETTEGLAGRCVLDSAYLSQPQADAHGFRIEGKSKNGTLDLERLATGFPGITYENWPYREGPLSRLGIPLVEFADGLGRAVLEGGEGDAANWEVSCFNRETPAWLGEQVVSAKVLEGVTWLGEGEAFGWKLHQEGARKAWVFVPKEPILGIPGKVDGFEVQGQLRIHTVLDALIRLPGAVPIAARRIHVQFKPKTAILWKCEKGPCVSVPVRGEEADAILESSARNLFLYWNDASGWIAEATATGKQKNRDWAFRWYLPKKDGAP